MVDIGIARYDVDENWGRESFGSDFGVINGITVDSQDRVYIANRKPEPRVLVFDPDGQFLASWGEDIFLKVGGIHGIKINREDEVFITDIEDHLVHQFTTDGKLVLSLGRRGQVGPTDMPFNRPTMAASNPGGDIFVSDGYGQFRIHRFSRNGDHICSWGSEGTGTGEFALPHGINVDPLDRVLVADRENARVQIFDQDGQYIEEWSSLKPPDINFDRIDRVLAGDCFFDLDGKKLAQSIDIRGHATCIDSTSSIYVTGVVAPDRNGKMVETGNLLKKLVYRAE
jgi:DNA-binding beta-propeller fold protein YncE